MQTSDNFAAGANTKPLYNRLFGTEGHEFLSANRTFWVDADDGSDTTGGGRNRHFKIPGLAQFVP